MTLVLDGFTPFQFPADCAAAPEQSGVYIFSVAGVPFYVGETQSLRVRMSDYQAAYWHACTDWRVGMAAKHFAERGYPVTVSYRLTADRKREEKDLLRELLLNDHRMLNSLPAYEYKTGDKQAELAHIHHFCQLVIEANAFAKGATR